MASTILSRETCHSGTNPKSWTWLPLTQSGAVKRRLNRKDRVRMLCPPRPLRETWTWLKRYARLFAFWRWQAIAQYEGGSWVTLKYPLSLEHIARHLLGNRLPTQAVSWVGTRSLGSTRFACIDVDADRPPNNMLDHRIEHATCEAARQRAVQQREREQQRRAQTTPFPERCQQVEDALRRLGIEPSDPTQVLIQLTPSGGRHYYFFLDASYGPDQVESVLEEAGLRNRDGQIEIYPRASRGLRMPFGYVPGRPFNPQAWLNFIKAYWFRKIRRFSLRELGEQLTKSAGKAATTTPPSSPGPPAQSLPASATHQLQPPRRRRRVPAAPGRQANQAPPEPAVERYLHIVERGPRSPQDAEELLAAGIQVPGTRTRVLLHLAIHLIWCRNHSEQAAREFLLTWAQDPRHESKDIQQDRANGTTTVTDHIWRICGWVARHQRPGAGGADATEQRSGPSFAASELDELRPHIQWLPAAERVPQAHFLLRFLAFARQHGRASSIAADWEAAPAINAVVKQWPGCRHGNDYKLRFDRAIAAGVLTMTKEKWQNPKGPGRARTYRLAIPVVLPEEQVIDYDAALARLTDTVAVSAQVEQASHTRLPSPTPAEPRQQPGEAANERDQPVENAAAGPANPPAVHPANPGTALAPAPRERPPQPGAPSDLPREAPGSSHRRRRPQLDRRVPPVRENVAELLAEEYRKAKDRRRQVERQQYWPKTWDRRPLPPPHDDDAITALLVEIIDELDCAHPGQHASVHATWKIVAAMARSPDYTTEERRLILSNPANLPEGQLQAWKALIRQHRQQIAGSSGLSAVTWSPRGEGAQMQIPKRKTERWIRRLGRDLTGQLPR